MDTSYEKFLKTIQTLSRNGVSHNVVLGSTCKVIFTSAGVKKTIAFTDNKLPFASLNLIKRVKKELLSNYDKIPNQYISSSSRIRRMDMTYIKDDFRKELTGIERLLLYNRLDKKKVKEEDITFLVEDVVEVDVKKAYLNISKKFELLSDKTYKDLYDLEDKSLRMICIGAMAAVKKKYTYNLDVIFDGKNFSEAYSFDEDLTLPKGRKMFFFLQNYLSSMMIDGLEGLYWYFFWVDQTYLPMEDALVFKERMEAKGLEVHFNKVLMVGTNLNYTIILDSNNEARYFPIKIK